MRTRLLTVAATAALLPALGLFFVRSRPTPAAANTADESGEIELPARAVPWVSGPAALSSPAESFPEFGDAAGRPRAGDPVAALFRRLDRDGDGRLDFRAELARWDADEDGAIGPGEFRRFVRTRVARLAGQVAAEQPAGVRLGLAAWFAALDADGDGRISPDEWDDAGLPPREYRRLDPAGVGTVTPAQAAAALAAGNRFLAAAVRDPAQDAGRAATGTAAAELPGPGGGSASAFGSGDTPRGPGASGGVGRFRPLVQAPPATRSDPGPRPDPPPPPPAPAAAAAADVDDLAVTPLPLDDGSSDYWVGRNFQNELRLLSPDPVGTLFLGDSITDWFANGAGAPVWDALFAPLGAADFAVAGVTTSHVLWQLETGQVASAAPQVVVLLIGTNNLGQGQSPAATARGIGAIVGGIRAQLPATRVLLLGLLPRGESADDPFRARVAEVNRSIANLDDGRDVRFLDIGGLFVTPEGNIPPRLMPDSLHPSTRGYALYARGVYWAISDLLNQQD
jgi:lysophospholipase L1-like esterase